MRGDVGIVSLEFFRAEVSRGGSYFVNLQYSKKKDGYICKARIFNTKKY